MKRITISLDDELHQWMVLRAMKAHCTLDALVTDMLHKRRKQLDAWMTKWGARIADPERRSKERERMRLAMQRIRKERKAQRSAI